jgi:hypothetical protein
MARQQVVLSAAQLRERLRNGYRDTLEGLPDYAAKDWRVVLIGWIAALLFSRGTAYRMVFHGTFSEIVKRDLNKFCYAARSTYTPESHAQTLRNEGRRQVWLRLQWYLNIDEKAVSDFNEEDEF